MAAKILHPLAVSAFCENLAMMLRAGVQTDEALSLMQGDGSGGLLNECAGAILERLNGGESLAEAAGACGYLPRHAARLIAAGEEAGRTDDVLQSLAAYYEMQDQLQKKLRSAVLYPAILLLMMALVLAVMVGRVLPVFTGVYAGLSGSVAASSYSYISAAGVIGRVAPHAARGRSAARAFGKAALHRRGLPPHGRGALYHRAGHLYGQRRGYGYRHGQRRRAGNAQRPACAVGGLPAADGRGPQPGAGDL